MAREGTIAIQTPKGKKQSRKFKTTVFDPNTGYALGKKTYKAVYRSPESGNAIYKETKYTPASRKKSSGVSASKLNKGGDRAKPTKPGRNADKSGKLNCSGGGASGKASKSCGPDSKKNR